ncbi:MAG: ribonuclease HII [Deltaproteobacteria bacterium]|nr:ribonuclease HII [Deltaproteobacteria bacterium]
MTHKIPSRFFEDKAFAEGYRFVAGIDEAGRGCLAGPVVAAAVILPRGYNNDSIRDSKQLSPAKREETAKVIQQEAIATGVGIVSSTIIDEINILQATLLSMTKALSALRIEPDFIFVDGNRALTVPLAQQTIVGGDALSISCAAASIIAKTTRDALMREYHQQFPYYDFLHNKGYGTSNHVAAIARWGFSPIHRRTFKTKQLFQEGLDI